MPPSLLNSPPLRLGLGLWLSLWLGATLAKQVSLQVSHDVRQAVIFGTSSALVERDIVLKDINLPAGNHTVELEGFYGSLEDASIRIASTADVTALDVKVITTSVPKDQAPEYLRNVASLEAKLDSACQVLSEHTHVQERNSFRQDAVKLLVTKRVSAEAPPLDMSAGLALIAAADEELQKLSKDSSGAAARLAEATRAVQALERQLLALKASASAGEATSAKTVVVHLRTAQAYSASNPLVLRMAYLCGPASWRPHYDVHIVADPSGAYSAQIDYMAQVWQQTGDDWNNVDLSLSTSSPADLLDLPRPARRVVGRTAPASMFSGMMGKSARGAAPMLAMSADYAMESAMTNEGAGGGHPVGMQAEALGDLTADHLFKVRHRVNVSHVLADQPHQHLLQVDRVAFPVSVFSYACPSAAEGAQLSALATYPAGLIPLVPSRHAKIHVEGSFTGTGSIPGAAAGQRLLLPLGPDKATLVTSEAVAPRNKGVEQDLSSWFVVDKKRYQVRTEERVINVHNRGSLQRLVLVAENLPRSTDDALKVELLSPSKADLRTLPPPSALAGSEVDSALLTDEDFMQAVLLHEFAAAAAVPKHSRPAAYLCAASGNVYWALWLSGGEKAAFSFKFSVTSPDPSS